MNVTNKLYNTQEASTYYREVVGISLSIATLRSYRSRKIGPSYRKVGRRVFYSKEDLDQFVIGVKYKTLDS